MPIVEHSSLPETPWRPNYRKWDIVRDGDGTTSSRLSYSSVGAGSGAPMHTHEADELIVVLEGVLEVRLGDEVQRVGPTDARLITFFPVSDPFDHTTYLEGTLPG